MQALGLEAWGHSVADFLRELSSRREVAEELQEVALELDKAYIPTRWPDAHPSGSPRRRYTRRESERLINYAQRILEFCKDLLSSL